MRKILLMLLIVAMLICLFPVVANASDMDYVHSASMSYTVQGNFMIYIPEEINVGSTVRIVADEINIPDGKVVKVSLSGLDMSNAIHLTNGITDDVVNVYFTRENGERYTYDNNVIGAFEAGSNGSAFEIGTEVDYEVGMIKAGTYTGNVDFYICYTDK